MKDVIGYEGLYAITSCGKVWSYKSKKFLKPRKTIDGYLLVNLYKNGKQKTYYVHRLVSEAYIPNPDNLPQVNHKNEDKTINHVNNLEWISVKNNINYGTRTERAAAATSKPVYCVELDKTFQSGKAAARELKLNNSYISACCNGRIKTTGGYHFQFAEVC